MSNNSAVVPTAEADLLGGEVREEDFASGAAAPAEEAYAAPAALVSLLGTTRACPCVLRLFSIGLAFDVRSNSSDAIDSDDIQKEFHHLHIRLLV